MYVLLFSLILNEEAIMIELLSYMVGILSLLLVTLLIKFTIDLTHHEAKLERQGESRH